MGPTCLCLGSALVHGGLGPDKYFSVVSCFLSYIWTAHFLLHLECAFPSTHFPFLLYSCWYIIKSLMHAKIWCHFQKYLHRQRLILSIYVVFGVLTWLAGLDVYEYCSHVFESHGFTRINKIMMPTHFSKKDWSPLFFFFWKEVLYLVRLLLLYCCNSFCLLFLVSWNMYIFLLNFGILSILYFTGKAAE